jgi:hypothetical protein
MFLQAQEGKLSQQEAATIMRCVLEFLQDCHARNICYGESAATSQRSACVPHTYRPPDVDDWRQCCAVLQAANKASVMLQRPCSFCIVLDAQLC